MECRNDEFHRARQLLLAVLLSSMLASVTAAGPDDWPMFRGHGARGVAEGHPVRSSWKITDDDTATEGVKWRAKVPGLGHSSPVVSGDRVFVVTAVSESGDAPLSVGRSGKPTAAEDNGKQSWLILCYDKKTGARLWQRTAAEGKPRATRHAKATHANSSVTISGNRLYAFLGSEGLHCYELDGQHVWSRDLGVVNISKYGIGWGYASSPAVAGDRIVLVCDDPDNPYVIALDVSDGSEVWRVARKGVCDRNWSTPLIHATDSRTQVVVNGWPWIVSYDLTDGSELWKIKGGGDNPVPTPFEAHGYIYITSSHGGQSPIHVVRPDASGDISPTGTGGSKSESDTAKSGTAKSDTTDSSTTDSDTTEGSDSEGLVWTTQRGGSYMSTPVVYGDYLYLGNSNGVVRCYQATSGEKIYEQRLGSGATMIASLVAADEKVFCTCENGTVYVLKAGPSFEVVARNQMSAPCFATPAISGGVLIFRTTEELIAIQ